MDKDRGFFGIVIPSQVLDNRELSVTEKFIYGYIASFTKCCFQSNDVISDRCGVSESTVKHVIPKLEKLGYIFVEKLNGDNSKRRIYSVLDNPKKLAYLSRKGMFKPVENYVDKPVQKTQKLDGVVQNLHDVVQNMHDQKTGVGSAKFAHIDIEENIEESKHEQTPNLENGPSGLAGRGQPADPNLPKPKDYESLRDWSMACAEYKKGKGATNNN